MRRPTFEELPLYALSLLLLLARLGMADAAQPFPASFKPVATPEPLPTQASAVPMPASPSAATSPAAASLSPTAAASAVPLALSSSVQIIDAKPSPTPSVVPTLVPGAPAAPGMPSGVFTVLTRNGQAPSPAIHLRWPAAEPGDYLIRSYRVWRSPVGAGSFELRPDDKAVLTGLSLDDPVQTGAVYDYKVEAVDSKGHAGPPSPILSMDLRKLPPEQVAPRSPEALTATSQRDTVKLEWRPSPLWVAPVSSYRVFRGESLGSLGAALSEVAGTSYVDTPSAKAKDFIYALAAVDNAGRVSAMSNTVSARATGAVAPGAPVGLTCQAKVEKVTLSWSPAPAGTSPVTAYLLRRREELSEVWKQVAYLPASTTTRTDTVPEGDKAYLYSVAAVDAEGLTGDAAFVGASPTAKLWNKTLVILMPTAYANGKDSDRGINLNVLFDFYVGSLYESYSNPLTNFTKTGLFQPLQIGTVTGDIKWALLDDRGLIPGLAAGFYGSALIPFGNPGGGQSVGVSSAGGGISTLGDIYGVFSKRFWPGEPRAAIHAGMMLGKLADNATADPSPRDWRPTLRHLLPGGDTPLLLNRFVDPKQAALVTQASNMAFIGFQVPFTVPLFFTQWRSGLRLEVMQPLPDTAEFSPNTQNTLGRDPKELLPTMFNIHVDNLPLFGFEFSYFKYEGGYQIIAFYHIPDLTWSW